MASSAGSRRIGSGSGIDYDRPLAFTFDGRSFEGYAGDTLASALLANGVSIVGRSFKYHRPRGVFSAGVEEPNALVRLGAGAEEEPVARATDVELFEGLAARSLNAWPSARRDLAGAVDRLHRFLPAGFYYKTFKWPGWNLHSRLIRRMAGLGQLPEKPDRDYYVKRNAWCDLLVVGSGPAGLSAAREAARAGATVMLLEQQPGFGGSARWRPEKVEGRDAGEWAREAVAELGGLPNVRMLCRTTAFGLYDDVLVAAVERVTDHLPPHERDGRPRQRLWKIRAAEVVVAAGAIERPLVFRNNDRPGIMLAGAAHEYLARYGVLLGERVVVATNNDSAYETALAFRRAGASVTLLDARSEVAGPLQASASAAGVGILWEARLCDASGVPVRKVSFTMSGAAAPKQEECDLVAVSGGWTPTLHLYSQAGGSLRFQETLQTFVPDKCPQPVRAVGAAAGHFDWADQAAPALSIPATGALAPSAGGTDRQWIDLHNDVTVADVELAARENFVSVEHLKRYTTTGMAVDQGKTSNVNALLHLAAVTGRTPQQVGTTKFRPPYTPVTFGALAGQVVGERFHPLRRLPLHQAHVEANALLTEMSGWLRPEYYPRRGESAADATRREALAVRTRVGLFDSSPLGKIELAGRDVGAFLDRIYPVAPSDMVVGEIRNAILANDEGIIFDDSHIVRLASHRYLLVTTTAAAPVAGAMIERYLQIEWPVLEVFSTPVTTQWAMMSLAGPLSREVLRKIHPASQLDDIGPMTAWQGRLEGVAARILRISYTGEHAYEIMVPAAAAPDLWDKIRRAGRGSGLELFGLEALDTLRIEKGFFHIGVETDGTTIPDDLSAGPVWEHGSLGQRSFARRRAQEGERLQLVGLLTEDARTRLPVGAEISNDWKSPSEGHVTSSVDSPLLRRPIALAMLASGRSRHGERLLLQHGEKTYSAQVTEPCFHDRDGSRL